MKPRLLRVKWLLACMAVSIVAIVSASVLALWLGRRNGTPVRAPEFSYFKTAPAALNIAHRGASADAPEHSLEAYRLALEQGAEVLELDLRMTKDAVLVVVHDEDLARISGANVRIADTTLAELRSIAKGRAPLPLTEVVAAFPGVRWNFELKADDPAQARALLAVITAHDLWERVVVASFHRGVVQSFREQSAGRVATAASGTEVVRIYACYVTGLACRIPYAVLQVPHESILDLTDPAFIRYAHGLGVDVHFWTVDDEPRMAALLDAGADGVMTNAPDRLARVLRARR